MEKLKDWIDLLLKIEERISYYWRFSTWLNVLTLGWVLFVTSKYPNISSLAKSLITIFYLGGYIGSWTTLLKEYSKHQTVLNEARNFLSKEENIIFEKLVGNLLKNPKLIVNCSHIIYAVILILIIWSPELFNTLKIKP